MREMTTLAAEPLQVPRRVTIGTKERPAHVVVDAVHVPPELIEKRHRLGADEPAAARHDGSFHDPGPPSVATSLRRLELGDPRRQIPSSSPGRTDTIISSTLHHRASSAAFVAPATPVLRETTKYVSDRERGESTEVDQRQAGALAIEPPACSTEIDRVLREQPLSLAHAGVQVAIESSQALFARERCRESDSARSAAQDAAG